MKSIFIKVTFCISLMFAMASTVFAQNQTQTAYEKKVFEIKKNYVKKILIQNGSWTRQSETELYYAGEDYINAALALGILTAPNLIKSLESELKAADKLKTSVDFQREKERKVEAEKTNKKLNTESSKNSKYFESKVEFYEAFISGNYKDILKTKKKK